MDYVFKFKKLLKINANQIFYQKIIDLKLFQKNICSFEKQNEGYKIK